MQMAGQYKIVSVLKGLWKLVRIMRNENAGFRNGLNLITTVCSCICCTNTDAVLRPVAFPLSITPSLTLLTFGSTVVTVPPAMARWAPEEEAETHVSVIARAVIPHSKRGGPVFCRCCCCCHCCRQGQQAMMFGEEGEEEANTHAIVFFPSSVY